ncbi:MAG TPA: hypothetical protein VJC12_01595 [Candidatus Paceibacterota bacterium]
MSNANAAIKVLLSSRGTVTLKSRDHIATGGQGSIYRLSTDLVVKIYSDPKQFRSLALPDKIKILSKLHCPYVVAPLDLAYSEKKEPIGYIMPYADAHPLSRVFTNDFWQREGFSASHAKELAEKMRETVAFAHNNGAILVDPNELNWLVKFKGSNPSPLIVDVDSWAIGRWGAIAVMPSIRDWHSKTFDENSDWFSWAVVTFQLFSGIHPYKGTHPSYDRSDLEKRMKDNASVFSKNVRLNRAVRNFSLIPNSLLNWYREVFERGLRTAPPFPFETGVSVPKQAMTMRVKLSLATGSLVFEKMIERENDPAVRIYECGVVLLSSGILLDIFTGREVASSISPDAEIIRNNSGYIVLRKSSGQIEVSFVDESSRQKEILPFKAQARGILSFADRLFYLGEGLTEIKVHSFGSKVICSAGETWSALPNATKLFSGVCVQDSMGSMFAIIPQENKELFHVRVPELDGSSVLAGRAGRRFTSFLRVTKSGEYERLDFTFRKDFSSYNLEVVSLDQPELNLAMLPKGVNASIIEDGKLLIHVPSTGEKVIIDDKNISTGMSLGNAGDHVLYIEDGALWRLKMK